MEKEVINNNKLPLEKDDEDDWESIPEKEQTEETKDVLYRLNIEGASKIKFDINKKKKYHSSKVKKLIQKEKESFYALDKYIKEKYIPNITITHNNNSNPYITILKNDFIIKQRPEIGTCLIYEMDDTKQEAKLIGKSDTWFEATIFKPKASSNKIKKNLSTVKINKSISITKKIKKEKKVSVINKDNKNENENKTFLKKKRKRKKKIKYVKNSTVFEIKRIFDNKEDIKEDNKNEINEENKEDNKMKEKQK